MIGRTSFLPELVSGTGTARRVVEGQTRRGFGKDQPENSIRIAQHIARSNTQRGNASARKPGIAHGVLCGPIAEAMHSAVDLDRQPRIAAKEIEHEISAGMLAAEFETAGALTQRPPQQHFGQREFSAQLARAVYPARFRFRRGVSQQRNSPSVSASRCHLPVPGRFWRG